MTRRLAPRPAGFSLIELLVSMAIGLVVTLAVTSVLIRSEGSKRSSTSVNDINQTGAFAAYVLDRAIRSAGSGFSQRWSDSYGCLLDVSQGSAHVLPLPSAVAASSAFKNLTMPIRLAPVIIGKGLADTTGAGGQVRGDVLLVMGGTAGIGESPQAISPTGANATHVFLPNTLGYRSKDLVLLSDASVTAGCLMQQVYFSSVPGGATFPPGAPSPGGSTDTELPFAQNTSQGAYYGGTGTNVSVSDFGHSTFALQLGNAADNPPQFAAFGVGANQTLVTYDLLQALPSGGGIPDVPIADGVVEMRALYGLDTTSPPDGVLDSWVDPVAGSGYEASVLTDGSAASRTKLRQIVAIRVGFILRTSLQERAAASSATGTTAQEVLQQTNVGKLFDGVTNAGGTSLSYARTLTSTDVGYRFRTVEVTIPLRNVQLAPQS